MYTNLILNLSKYNKQYHSQYTPAATPLHYTVTHNNSILCDYSSAVFLLFLLYKLCFPEETTIVCATSSCCILLKSALYTKVQRPGQTNNNYLFVFYIYVGY